VDGTSEISPEADGISPEADGISPEADGISPEAEIYRKGHRLKKVNR
jgi:hypothetical protein